MNTAACHARAVSNGIRLAMSSRTGRESLDRFWRLLRRLQRLPMGDLRLLAGNLRLAWSPLRGRTELASKLALEGEIRYASRSMAGPDGSIRYALTSPSRRHHDAAFLRAPSGRMCFLLGARR